MSRSLNYAKRAVVKDPRFFEAVGYPRKFERVRAFELIGDLHDANDQLGGGSGSQ